MKHCNTGESNGVTDTERRHGIVRENSLSYAMQLALPGEDPLAILARAALFEEYVLFEAGRPSVLRNRDQSPLNAN